MNFQIQMLNERPLFFITFLLILISINLLASLKRFNREFSLKDKFLKYFIINFLTLYLGYKTLWRLEFLERRGISLNYIEWLNWFLVISTFSLFILIYAFRGKALKKAEGFLENIFPLFVIFLPILIYESYLFSKYYPSLFTPLIFVNSKTQPFLYALATLTMFLGNALNVWSLSNLKGSFSVLVQARNFVHSGPYRWIRHPLYMGEYLSTIGFTILVPSPFNITLSILFILLQNFRAGLEEEKLRKTFPEYEIYLKQTRRYIPFI